ncbi:MAG: hypothetical protein MUD11_13195 [Rhodobacteraceae bacterium]|jgi:hypothetical protein|nr:hypothetical protein [Paracoccaceae bacterium]
MSFRFAVLAAILTGVTPAVAQDAAPALALELNGAADTPESACRLTYVANNGLSAPLEQTSFQMAVFDTAGAVTRLIVLDFGALAVGKTKVVQFDIPGQTCAQISRIVVNDVAQCTTTGGAAVEGCLAALATASRSSIQFGL